MHAFTPAPARALRTPLLSFARVPYRMVYPNQSQSLAQWTATAFAILLYNEPCFEPAHGNSLWHQITQLDSMLQGLACQPAQPAAASAEPLCSAGTASLQPYTSILSLGFVGAAARSSKLSSRASAIAYDIRDLTCTATGCGSRPSCTASSNRQADRGDCATAGD